MIRQFFFFLLILSLLLPLFQCENKKKSENVKQETKFSEENKIPGITVSADRNKVRTGDLINLAFQYYIPEESSFNSETDLTGLDGLSVISRQIDKNEIKLTVIIDKTASFDIGPVSLSFKDKKGDLNIIRTEKKRIEVISNLGNKPAEVQVKPIMDIIPTYPLWLKMLPWIAVVFFLLLIGAGLYYWKKRKRLEIKNRISVKLPHVIATEELRKLRAMNFIENGEFKEFYFRFSEILRQYLEQLRGFPAAELTIEEISRRIIEEKDRKLIPVLREADLVKFADTIPTKAKNEEDMRTALEYIKETTPLPQAAEQQLK